MTAAPLALARMGQALGAYREQWRAVLRGVDRRRLALRVAAPLLALAALLGLWQGYATLAGVNPLILPAPLHVLQVTTADWPNLAAALRVTLYETVVGFGWAFVLGLSAAALLDLALPLRAALYPLLVASQSIPIIALAPLLQLWFGIGLPSKIIIIVLVCFFPITVAGLDGLRATDPELIRLYRSFGASRWRILRAVRLPNAVPTIFSGVRIAIAYSVVGAIFSEYIGAEQGIGVYMQAKQRAFRVDLVVGAIAVTAIASVALFLLVMLVERVAIPWYFAERRKVQ